MNKRLLIDIEYLKSVSTYDLNIDDSLITTSIDHCQNEYIRKQGLGSSLYQQIIDQINAGTLSTENRTLVDNFAAPALAAYVQWDCLEDLHYRPTDKGLQVMKSDTSDPATDKGFDRYKSKLLDRAQNKLNDLRLYLLANTELYREYLTPTSTDVDTVYPNTESPFMEGIYTQSKADRYKYIWTSTGKLRID